MTLNIVSSFNGVSDPDAAAYIEAVEAADGELLEFAVGKAINDFVLGCKADGIWDAIKASCILAGARTLSGALVPLAGTAPTNFNFVSGDYNRKTGLVGDGSTKYLDSNRNNNTDPQNNQHLFAAVSSVGAYSTTYMGAGGAEPGASYLGIATAVLFTRSRNQTGLTGPSLTVATRVGVSRSASDTYTTRCTGVTNTNNQSSQAPVAGSIHIFQRNAVTPLATNARLAFYSIGEALDLAKLDARVTTLINAFGAAIP